MPIFTSELRELDYSNPTKALKDMAKHIRKIQEELEWTLTNLDSSNITEIEADKTNITTSDGSAAVLTGDRISLNGKNGENFTAGVDASGKFVFTLKGKDGTLMFYLNEGAMTISRSSNLTIDCGEW